MQVGARRAAVSGKGLLFTVLELGALLLFQGHNSKPFTIMWQVVFEILKGR